MQDVGHGPSLEFLTLAALLLQGEYKSLLGKSLARTWYPFCVCFLAGDCFAWGEEEEGRGGVTGGKEERITRRKLSGGRTSRRWRKSWSRWYHLTNKTCFLTSPQVKSMSMYGRTDEGEEFKMNLRKKRKPMWTSIAEQWVGEKLLGRDDGRGLWTKWAEEQSARGCCSSQQYHFKSRPVIAMYFLSP